MVKEAVIPSYREILSAYWSYQTVLYLALGYLPKGVNRLTADFGRWNEVVCELKQEFPDFFPNVHFLYRDPLPPHSDQIEDFLFFAGVSEVFQTTSSYEVYLITDKAKIRLRERAKGKFSQEQIEAIRKISPVINEKLVIPPTNLPC